MATPQALLALAPQDEMLAQELVACAQRLWTDAQNPGADPRRHAYTDELQIAYVLSERSASQGETTEQMARLLHGPLARHVELVFARVAAIRPRPGDGALLSCAARTGTPKRDAGGRPIKIAHPWIPFYKIALLERDGPFLEYRTFNRAAPEPQMDDVERAPVEVPMYEFLTFHVTPHQADLALMAAAGPAGYHARDSMALYDDHYLHPAAFNSTGSYLARMPLIYSRSDVYVRAFCSQFVAWVMRSAGVLDDPNILPDNALAGEPDGRITPPMIVQALLDQLGRGVTHSVHPINPSFTTQAFGHMIGGGAAARSNIRASGTVQTV